MKNISLTILMPLLVIVLSMFTVLPLFHSGFYSMHDDTQVARVYEMKQSLTDGMFPVRWVKDLGYGYGYPIFNFYAPLSYYTGGVVNVLGLDSLTATKVMIFIGIILAGISMFLLASAVWGVLPGIVAAVFYLYAPYHALDIYVRGDVSELWAYACIPFVFWALYRGFKTQKFLYLGLGAFSYASVILSHNLSALMLTPYVLGTIVIILFSTKRNELRRTFSYFTAFVLLGMLIASFYFLPALTEMKYTNVLSQVGGGADFRDHFVCIPQLWNSLWGYGGSTKGCLDGLSFQVGKVHMVIALLVLVLSVFAYQKKCKKDREKYVILLIAFLGLLISLFLTTEYSKAVWESLSPMAFLQYPWRFLLIASFCISFISGSLIYYLSLFFPKRFSSYISIVSAVLIIGCIYSTSKFFVPQRYVPTSNQELVSNKELTWRVSKISDEYLPKDFNKPTASQQENIQKQLNQLLYSFVRINVTKNMTQEKTMNIKSSQDAEIPTHIAYFPAWTAFQDNRQIDFTEFHKEIILPIKKGTHMYSLKFQQTHIEILSNLLSLVGIVGVIIGIIGERLRKYEKHNS